MSPAHPLRALVVLTVGVAALFADLWLVSGPHLAGLARLVALAGLSALTAACLVTSFRLLAGRGPRGDERLPGQASP